MTKAPDEVTTHHSRPLLVEQPIKVKTYDIDSAAHVSNIVYFRWLEDLRLLLIEKHFSLEEFVKNNYQPIITSSQIEYKRAIKLFDKPTGYMWLSELTSARMKFEGEILVNGIVTTRASHIGVFVDVVTGRPRKLPELVIQKFREAQSSH